MADVMKATSGMRDGNFSGRSFIETSLSAQIRVFLASKHKAPGDIPSRVGSKSHRYRHNTCKRDCQSTLGK